MAQTQSPTNEGYGELGKFFAGEAATCAKSIVLVKTSCTADEDQTYAGITKATETGLGIADATVTSEKTTVTDDTTQAVYTHTAGETLTVLGAGLCNDDNNALYMICCYNAGVALQSSDTLKNTLSMQFKKGS